jgi:lysozyme
VKIGLARIFILLQAAQAFALAGNSVLNLSHYDLLRPDFVRMKEEGILGVIHEATYPRWERDAFYSSRAAAAANAGLLWGAYHYADGTDPVRQADYFLSTVLASAPQVQPPLKPTPVLLVLDFEKNGHYRGGTMRVDQAVSFVERIKERTGVYPGIYSGEYRIRSVLNSSKISSSQKRILSNCWLWIANYHYEPHYYSPWNRWSLWQYTGDGRCSLPRAFFPTRVANVARAERNIFNGDASQLTAFWTEHGWQPTAKVASR